ncbi:MAG TPA: bifunctional hydroxymethylpyrimidine kinase/phosphomethylpyrimidine kinase, partial [Armatimonadota bacterium]|nr:bifunctional hydroxymethylpyrimidine kinase/phosphomethylpyrimidine kinase [Armatimonadota bacterium]
MNNVPPCALTIAGSDSSGGAGIQADLKTFAAFGVYGASVITAITAQNTLGVQAVFTLPVDTVIAQLDAVLSDLPISVVKIGMLSSAEIVSAVADRLSAYKGLNIVVDTVLVSSSGKPLLSEEAIQCLTNKLLPCATVITPNHPEASHLLGLHRIDDPEQAAYDLLRFNAEAVLLKGGHMESSEIDDILVTHDTIQHFRHAKLQTNHTHGTGCSL